MYSLYHITVHYTTLRFFFFAMMFSEILYRIVLYLCERMASTWGYIFTSCTLFLKRRSEIVNATNGATSALSRNYLRENWHLNISRFVVICNTLVQRNSLISLYAQHIMYWIVVEYGKCSNAKNAGGISETGHYS